MPIPPASRRSPTIIMAGAEAPRFAFRPLTDSDLIELPVTTVDVAGRRLAAGGGGFFRLLPYALLRAGRSAASTTTEGRPAIFYFHPWEIDPGQPRVAGAPLKSRLRHYSRLSAMRGKLLKLLKAYEWGRTDAVAAAEAASGSRERLRRRPTLADARRPRSDPTPSSRPSDAAHAFHLPEWAGGRERLRPASSYLIAERGGGSSACCR